MIEDVKPQADQPTTYTPAGPPDPLIFESFEGINTATLRPGVDDKEAYWLDGFMPLGPMRNLRTMYGVSAALYAAVAPISIAFFDFGNIGSTPYCIIVQSDGSVIAVNTSTGIARTIAVAGTILNPSRTSVGFAQYGSQYFVIVSKQTNGYFIWDGTTFFTPGASFTGTGGGTMPTAISGTAVEIYAGRVWIANGATITFSVPGSLVDFLIQ